MWPDDRILLHSGKVAGVFRWLTRISGKRVGITACMSVLRRDYWSFFKSSVIKSMKISYRSRIAGDRRFTLSPFKFAGPADVRCDFTNSWFYSMISSEYIVRKLISSSLNSLTASLIKGCRRSSPGCCHWYWPSRVWPAKRKAWDSDRPADDERAYMSVIFLHWKGCTPTAHQ